MVEVAHPAVSGGLTLSYKGGPAAAPCAGLDRFGRVAWQTWKKTDGTVLDRWFYGYDRASNRLWRAERIAQGDPEPDGAFPRSPRDEAYAYDGLHRLVLAQRGQVPKVAGQPPPPWAPNPGDADYDGDIDLDDYDRIDAGYYDMACDKVYDWGDFNRDDDVTFDDYHVIDYYSCFPEDRDVARTWAWSLDALGNWALYREDAGPGGPDPEDWDLVQTAATTPSTKSTPTT